LYGSGRSPPGHSACSLPSLTGHHHLKGYTTFCHPQAWQTISLQCAVCPSCVPSLSGNSTVQVLVRPINPSGALPCLVNAPYYNRSIFLNQT